MEKLSNFMHAIIFGDWLWVVVELPCEFFVMFIINRQVKSVAYDFI